MALTAITLNTHSLLHANEAATQNGVADLAELTLDAVTPELPTNELARYLAQLNEGVVDIACDNWVLRASGRRPVEARWQALKTGGLTTPGPALVMCMLRDISSRRQPALDARP